MANKSTGAALLLLVAALAAGPAGAKPPIEGFDELPAAGPGEPGLRARHFGVSTLLLTDGSKRWMIDGFFSRPAEGVLKTGKIRPDVPLIEGILQREAIAPLDALLIAHAHHDHAMDAGVVARATGAFVYGSRSAINVALGRPDGVDRSRTRAIGARSGDLVEVGDFDVLAYQVPHGPTPVFIRFPGQVSAPLETPIHVSHYRMGENLAFWVRHRLACVLVLPSVGHDVLPFDGVQADVVLLGVGGYGRTHVVGRLERLWNAVVKPTGAKLVVPIHWDDFMLPYGRELKPTGPPFDDLGRTMAALRRFADRDGVALKFMPVGEEVILPARTPPPRAGRCG